MPDVTQILSQIESGDPAAAEQLLPLVYDELRKLAALQLDKEKPGQTLQATALVHDAYIRLVDVEKAKHWDSRGHFFAAAAESMRRILVDQARRKLSLKRGGDLIRQEIEEARIVDSEVGNENELLALSDALDHLAEADHEAAELVKLRYFAGLTSEQAAEVLGISSRTADRIWGLRPVILASRDRKWMIFRGQPRFFGFSWRTSALKYALSFESVRLALTVTGIFHHERTQFF